MLRYLSVAESLAGEIASGRHSATGFLPAERDLAERLGVSRTTVRAALRHLEAASLVRPEHGRGHRIIAPGNHKAEPLRAVAIIMPFVTASTMHQIMQGCGSVLQEEGFDVIRIDTTSDTSAGMRKRERAAIHSLLRKPMLGAIWWPSYPNEQADLTDAIKEARVPVVTVDRTLPGLPFDHVGVDNVRAAYGAMEHLITEGHVRIGHLTQEAPASTVAERRRGYEQALRDHGLQVYEEDIIVWRDSASERAKLCHLLLSRSERPTALFCVNDYIAVEMLLLLQDFGARIPQDIALVGFDNARESTLVRPALTTVAQPLNAIGQSAARLLLDRCTGRTSGPPVETVLATELIVRESSVR